MVVENIISSTEITSWNFWWLFEQGSTFCEKNDNNPTTYFQQYYSFENMVDILSFTTRIVQRICVQDTLMCIRCSLHPTKKFQSG
jgi:hypothetical protein